MARFINLTCNVEGIMEDTCDWMELDERTKQQIKIVVKLFILEKHRPADWISKDAFIMGVITSALIAILHQMKEDNDTLGEVFYNILNACETHNMSGEINEGQYLELVNSAAKTKKIIDYALRVPYDVAQNYSKKFEWVDVNGFRHLNIHYEKPAAPVLAQ
jgi:hypothetical protein